LPQVTEGMKLAQLFAGPWTFDGQRTAFMVFDLPDASGIPPFPEPFFRELNANVQLAPVMNADDLQTGLSQLG
jgi:hypothetical protein